MGSQSLFVFLGAGAGGVLRYWIGQWLGRSDGFPWATLSVNLVGSLAIGLFMAVSIREGWNPTWRLFVAVGLLGGFTTFSAFSHETIQLLGSKAYLSALAYVMSSVGLSLLACAFGWALGGGATRPENG